MNLTVLLFGPGGGEIMVVLVLVLLLFGSKKIPEFARGLGKGIRQFKDATEGIQRDIKNNVNDVKKDINIKKELDKMDPTKD